ALLIRVRETLPALLVQIEQRALLIDGVAGQAAACSGRRGASANERLEAVENVAVVGLPGVLCELEPAVIGLPTEVRTEVGLLPLQVTGDHALRDGVLVAVDGAVRGA